MSTISNDFPYYTISDYLKSRFGCKVIKLSLDGGFTCPNRDGSKGLGGCVFCSASGSGEFASDIPSQIALLSKKWGAKKYIAYFQSHTGTYARADELRDKYSAALADTGVVGLAIATRPDCLGEDVLALLDEMSRKTFLWVELGLQTAHDETARRMNRCYDLADFDAAMESLSALGIKVVTHLILGLPGETKKQMLDSVRYACGINPLDTASFKGNTQNKAPFGIKLHMLNVVRNTPMEKLYPGYIPFRSIDEYVGLVADALEIIPPGITIHRITADVPRGMLISPEWSYKKRSILNGVYKEMKERGSRQGIHSSP